MRQEHADFVAPGSLTALERWGYWRHWAPPAGASANTAHLERAMRCLFLNRTTFSGVLHGRAGPIGGRAQTSDYTIGCRYNREALTHRIEFIGQLYEAGRLADVWCMDWRDTMNQVASTYKTLVPDHVLAYLDPPYLDKSAKLYTTSFSGARQNLPDDWTEAVPHERLAAYLTQQIRYSWVLSYDYQPQLLKSCLLYGRDRMTPDAASRQDGVRQWRISKRLVKLNYTASARKGRGAADELLITTLPPSSIPTDEQFRSLHS